MGGPQITAADVAGHYDERYYRVLADRYRKQTRFARQRIANVFSLLPPVEGLRVLDLGCAIGTFTIEAGHRGAKAIGLDPIPEAIAAALRLVESGQDGVQPGRTNFVLADAARLPIATASVDIAIAADLTEHLDSITLRRILAETARALRPNGAMVIYTPSPSHLFERLRAASLLLRPDPSHIGMRSAKALTDELEEAGLRPERLRYLPSHLPGWNVLERALGRYLPLLRRRIGILARKAGAP